MSSSAVSYLDYLQSTVEGLHELPCGDHIDANERLIFELICAGWSKGHPLSVNDVIRKVEFGSQTTLHKRLKRLFERELLLVHFEGTNRRTKYLYPSEKGKACIEWFSAKFAAAKAAQPHHGVQAAN